MQNLELLKQQLIAQKDMLESKGITVTCAHTNPSPTELTTAISHISPVDMSLATVTPNDVVSGKKYYDATGTLQTGTYVDPYSAIMEEYKLGYLPETFTDEGFYRPFVFSGCTSRTKKHTIMSTVTTLPEYAFYSTQLEEVIMPNGLTTVGAYAFDLCGSLKKLVMADTITKIGNYSFSNLSGVTELHFSTGLTSLPIGTFRYLNSMTDIVVPANIKETSIGNFMIIPNCNNLYFECPEFKFAPSATLGNYKQTLKIWLTLSALCLARKTGLWQYRRLLYSKYEITDETEFPVIEHDGTFAYEWYGNLDDATNRTNVITAPNGAGTYYARIVM